MELTAVIRALESVRRASRVVVHTDSQYVQKGISEWLRSWKARGWKTADRKPVKNEDLWRELDALVAQHEIDWRWVRGHAGHPENERADALANRGVDRCVAARCSRNPGGATDPSRELTAPRAGRREPASLHRGSVGCAPPAALRGGPSHRLTTPVSMSKRSSILPTV